MWFAAHGEFNRNYGEPVRKRTANRYESTNSRFEGGGGEFCDYVLDIGTLEKIRSGDIKVVPGIKRFTNGCVELVNGEKHDVDAVVLATGYRSNVPSWLQEGEFFSKNGFPKSPFPNGWKGNGGLYAVGFTKRGLSGASSDASLKILDKSGNKRLSKRNSAPLLVIDAAFPSFRCSAVSFSQDRICWCINKITISL